MQLGTSRSAHPSLARGWAAARPHPGFSAASVSCLCGLCVSALSLTPQLSTTNCTLSATLPLRHCGKFAPLFSHTYKHFFPQPLSFDIDNKTPGVYPHAACRTPNSTLINKSPSGRCAGGVIIGSAARGVLHEMLYLRRLMAGTNIAILFMISGGQI